MALPTQRTLAEREAATPTPTTYYNPITDEETTTPVNNPYIQEMERFREEARAAGAYRDQGGSDYYKGVKLGKYNLTNESLAVARKAQAFKTAQEKRVPFDVALRGETDKYKRGEAKKRELQEKVKAQELQEQKEKTAYLTQRRRETELQVAARKAGLSTAEFKALTPSAKEALYGQYKRYGLSQAGKPEEIREDRQYTIMRSGVPVTVSGGVAKKLQEPVTVYRTSEGKVTLTDPRLYSSSLMSPDVTASYATPEQMREIKATKRNVFEGEKFSAKIIFDPKSPYSVPYSIKRGFQDRPIEMTALTAATLLVTGGAASVLLPSAASATATTATVGSTLSRVGSGIASYAPAAARVATISYVTPKAAEGFATKYSEENARRAGLTTEEISVISTRALREGEKYQSPLRNVASGVTLYATDKKIYGSIVERELLNKGLKLGSPEFEAGKQAAMSQLSARSATQTFGNVANEVAIELSGVGVVSRGAKFVSGGVKNLGTSAYRYGFRTIAPLGTLEATGSYLIDTGVTRKKRTVTGVLGSAAVGTVSAGTFGGAIMKSTALAQPVIGKLTMGAAYTFDFPYEITGDIIASGIRKGSRIPVIAPTLSVSSSTFSFSASPSTALSAASTSTRTTTTPTTTTTSTLNTNIDFEAVRGSTGTPADVPSAPIAPSTPADVPSAPIAPSTPADVPSLAPSSASTSASTSTSTSTSTSASTSTSTSTSVLTTVFTPRLPIAPPIGLPKGTGKGFKLPKLRGRAKTRYTPSAYAIFTGIRGAKPSKISLKTGLTVRPITTKKKKNKNEIEELLKKSKKKYGSRTRKRNRV